MGGLRGCVHHFLMDGDSRDSPFALSVLSGLHPAGGIGYRGGLMGAIW